MRGRGFTLVEMLTALVILSIVGLMSYRGLSTIVDTRDRVAQDVEKWRGIASFFERVEHDLAFAAPRAVRGVSGERPAFVGYADGRIEFSRFAAGDATGTPHRVAYRLNAAGEIELMLWSALDAQPEAQPARYPALTGVKALELQFLGSGPTWLAAWSPSPTEAALPRAVRVRIVLVSGEDIVRIFAVQS